MDEMKRPMEFNGHFIYFEKEEYTVPEVIKRVAEHYNITITKRNRKSGRLTKNSDYDTLYGMIKKRLDEKVIDEEGEDLKSQDSTERKTTYPRDYVNHVVNHELRDYFAKFPSTPSKRREKEFKELEDLAIKYEKEFKDGTYGDFIADLHKTEEEMRSPEHEGDRYVAESFQYHKQEILMDVVFNHLIILDEDKLRTDLAIALTADDATPSAQELEALERLKKYRNYYRWRTEKLDDLLDN